jgi:uncharacterized protein (UPF0548 family)
VTVPGRPQAGFTYPEAGATLSGAPLPPPGYHLLCVHTGLGHGERLARAAGEALLSWRMHRAAGATVDTAAPRAEPGAEVTVSLGAGPLRLTAPCRVAGIVREPGRVGFAYGTLPGHPVTGEEAFFVERLPGGAVRLAVVSFSRAAAWYARAAGPLTRAGQRAVARRYGRALRRLVREAGRAG